MCRLIAVALLLCLFAGFGGANAEPVLGRDDGGTVLQLAKRHARHPRHHSTDANGNTTSTGLVTVSTAAGIDITVAPSFASAMQGFIADAVAEGYRPARIKCYSLSRSHVPGSLHFRGEACDFNQHGWGKTDRFMYHVAALARKHGLRDGCSFSDCGHIDSGGRSVDRRARPRTVADATR